MVQGYDLDELANRDRLAKALANYKFIDMSGPEGLKKFDAALSEVISTKFRSIAAKIAMDVTKKIRLVQKELFHTMVTQVVGHSGPPDLGEFTPQGWRALDPKYAAYRKKSRDIPSDVFYDFNSSNLSDKGHYGKTLLELLTSANPETVFGKPKAVPILETKVAGRGKRPASIQDSIAIVPFPKIDSKTLQPHQLQLKSYFKSTNKDIAYKLTNWHGKIYRPVLEYYLLWWVNVRLKKVLAESVAKYKNKKGIL